MNILVLGDAKDAHARHIFEASKQTGAKVSRAFNKLKTIK